MERFEETRLAGGVTAAQLPLVIIMAAPQVAGQNARTEALEQSLRQLEAGMQAIRSELNQLKSDSAREAQKLIKIEERSVSVEQRQAAEAQKWLNGRSRGSGKTAGQQITHGVFPGWFCA